LNSLFPHTHTLTPSLSHSLSLSLSLSPLLWLSHTHSRGRVYRFDTRRGVHPRLGLERSFEFCADLPEVQGNKLNCFKDFSIGNDSSQGQNLAYVRRVCSTALLQVGRSIHAVVSSVVLRCVWICGVVVYRASKEENGAATGEKRDTAG